MYACMLPCCRVGSQEHSALLLWGFNSSFQSTPKFVTGSFQFKMTMLNYCMTAFQLPTLKYTGDVTFSRLRQFHTWLKGYCVEKGILFVDNVVASMHRPQLFKRGRSSSRLLSSDIELTLRSCCVTCCFIASLGEPHSTPYLCGSLPSPKCISARVKNRHGPPLSFLFQMQIFSRLNPS